MTGRRPQGSIRRHGAGWQIRFKGECRQVHGTNLEAERELAKLVVEVEGGTVASGGRIKTGAYLVDKWLPHQAHQVRRKTWTRYEQLVRLYVCPVVGSIQLRRLRPLDVQRVVDQMLSTGAASASATQAYHVLAVALEQAVLWQLISVNPARAIRAPRPEHSTLHVPTPAEARLLVAEAEGSWIEGAVVIASGTGMRLSEILGLPWSNVDLDRAVLRVDRTISWEGSQFAFEEPKTSYARRTIALPPTVLRWLKRHRRDQSERRLTLGSAWRTGPDVVLDGGDGTPLRDDSVSSAFANLAERAGMPAVRFHDLRHAYATRLFEASVHPKVVSEALGHASVAFTMQVYQHVMPSMQEAAAKAIEQALRRDL